VKHSILLILAIITLAGCQAEHVEVVKVTQEAPLEVENPKDLASVKFDRLGVKIRRGTIIGSYEPSLLGLSGCIDIDSNIFWNTGRVLSRDVEFADIFYHTLKDADFNVVGDPNLMFASAADRQVEAEFLIGGQLEEIKMNVCEEMNMWTGGSRGTQRGKGSVKVRWQVFSNFERKVVYEEVTEGYADVQKATAGGELLIIQDAFAAAVDNLIAKPTFLDLLKNYQPAVAAIDDIEDTTLVFKKLAISDKPIAEIIDDVRLAVVSIDASGAGHGSGFFVSPRLILTNHHVVGEAEFVRVNLLTGRKIIGNVIRRHPARDIALVQVEALAIKPLAIREEPVSIAEEVFAVGSPLSKNLSGTVTKGIVSKFLVNRRGLEDIQGDVDIQGGNSGGPLLDKNGNVVGISYAGYGVEKFSAGVNFFIPIMDGMRRIKIEMRERVPES